jgi:hypothetical protein
MINKLTCILKRIIGIATIHANGSAIKGDYSQGRRDMFGKDWYRG